MANAIHVIKSVVEYYNIKCFDDIVLRWQERHRYYHTLEHLADLADEFSGISNEEQFMILLCAAVFHDIVYVPGATDNEERSVDVLAECIGDEHPHFTELRTIILDTKDHNPQSELSRIFSDADMKKVSQSTVQQLLDWDKKIFLEFQKFDYSFYRLKRVEFLREMVKRYPTNADNINILINYVENYRPRIGVYAGSFNPFHNGHLNILSKAQKLFDKVIVAQGVNPEKRTDDTGNISSVNILEFVQTEQFSGLLTEYVNVKEEYADITLIRGLRNGNDLAYESNQLRFMEYLKPNLKVVFILCDKEYEHISSSALRNLEKVEEGLSKPYVPLEP